jgi:hypothetical protein
MPGENGRGLSRTRRRWRRCTTSSRPATTRTDSRVAEGATQPQALTDGFSLAFWVAFGFAALSILATVLAIRRADLRADVSPATAAT